MYVGIDERIELVNNMPLLVEVLHAMSIMEVGRHYSKDTVIKGVKLI